MLRYILCLCLLLGGCSHFSSQTLLDSEVEDLILSAKEHEVEGLTKKVAVFENVAFGLGLPLRRYLQQDPQMRGKTVLDLGAGCGVLSMIALSGGAKKSVATEINPYAVANAKYNAERFGFLDKLDVRLVSMDNRGAYSVIDDEEKFDLIVSNPPQGTSRPISYYAFSYADPELAFLKSILEGLDAHLTPRGKGVFTLYPRGMELAEYVANERGLNLSVKLKTYNRNGVYYLVEVARKERSM